VDYFVEGSGQKIGDNILLNVQLIEALNDEHLWAEQYNREATDIFNLQKEVAKNIADKIEAVITPEEEERINKPPTDNLVAYDYFLKGLDLLYKGNSESLEESIIYFKKAIEHDNEFARAYADIAIAYYFLDIYQKEKQYANEMNEHADKALLFDPKLPQSLVAKGLFYIHEAAYDLAVPYLEKALYYNPNSAFTLNTLSDLYANYIPNTEKYLEYAIKGIGIDIAAHDSITASFVYLHVSNAFIQSGFVEEAEKYINKSLEYHPGNIYSAYVRAYILFSKNRDLQKLKIHLLETLAKDSSRLDVLQEVGKVYYYLRDYDSAYRYYKKYYGIRQAFYLDIYKAENAKIGVVYSKVGLEEESEKFFADYLDYAENDKSIYRHLSLAAYYSWIGEVNISIEELRLFSQEENYHYWILLFLEMDPLIDHIKDQPAFHKLMRKIETKFWENHKQIATSLEEKGLI
jgi:tetratricopeptide (TPR) repeat protein